MRDFGLIHTRYWTWAQEHGLSDSAKLIGAYILTCEHGNSLGCFRCPKAYVAEDLGYSIDTVSKGYGILESKGLIRYCEASKWLLIPKFLHWNRIQNPKHASSVLKNVSQIPSSFQLGEILVKSLKQYGGRHLEPGAIDTVSDTLCHTVSHTVPIQREGEGEGYVEGEGEKKPSSQLLAEGSREFELATLLFSLIQQNDPKAKKPNLQTWAKDMDGIIRLDGRDPPEVEAVIRWCQRDPFWKTNILSAGKLRKQFGQLAMKMKGGNGNGKPEPERFSEKRYEGSDLDSLPWNQEGDV